MTHIKGHDFHNINKFICYSIDFTAFSILYRILKFVTGMVNFRTLLLESYNADGHSINYSEYFKNISSKDIWGLR